MIYLLYFFYHLVDANIARQGTYISILPELEKELSGLHAVMVSEILIYIIK
jgi:hypothetical protein